jgi:hypothetical protein
VRPGAIVRLPKKNSPGQFSFLLNFLIFQGDPDFPDKAEIFLESEADAPLPGTYLLGAKAGAAVIRKSRSGFGLEVDARGLMFVPIRDAIAHLQKVASMPGPELKRAS